MKRVTFNILFFVKRTKARKNGKLPIYVRITVSGQRAEFVTQKEVFEHEWNKAKGCVKGHSNYAREINEFLDYIKMKLNSQKIEMEIRNITISAYSLRDAFTGKTERKKTVLSVFADHNQKCLKLKNIDFSPKTVERYFTCYNHLETFIKQNYKKLDMELQDVSPMFIREFEIYLKTERKCTHNTTVKYIQNFKKIIRIALANGWITSDPFINIRYRLDEVDVDYLTKEELEKVANYKFSIQRLQQVRDVYLFCCYTGLAFIDVKNLTQLDIIEKDGMLWIKKKRQKTKNWCNVPLIKPAVKIIEKYKTSSFSTNNNLILPVSSNQKMNAYLKEIASLCEIQKNLSTHTARHTFATTVTLSNNVSLEVVSKMLGHSSTTMTKRYARVVDDLVNREMEKVRQIYAG